MAEKIRITFPDGAVKEFPKGVTTEEIAAFHQHKFEEKSLGRKIQRSIRRFENPLE